MGDIAIGIDLGTSNSCVAAVIDGEPRVLANAFDERTTASVVSFAENGDILVGNQAKERIVLDPTNTVYSAKRLIGRYSFSEEVKKAQAVCRYQIVSGEGNTIRVRVREEEFSLAEISAFILKEMKNVAEKELGQEIGQAVITVPAYFNDNQRQATKDAGRIAGLEVLRILNEPTAAALSYGYGRNLHQRVGVYDLGGGTFDVSVLEIGDEAFEVLSTCGDTYLGGDDFDDRLIDLFAERVQTDHGLNVRTDPIAFEKLRAAAEHAKIALSGDDSVQIDIPDLANLDDGIVGLSYELTSKEFDKLTLDLIQRTFKVCDEAMQQAHLTTRDLDGVILVGGPTRLPTIRKAVEAYFQTEPEAGINPDEVVAVGAAIHANSLVAESSETFLFDVTPLSLRLGIAGGMSDVIIDRNSPLPIDTTRIFNPAQDNQESVAVKIYQGESRPAEGNELLGSFAFTGYEPGPRDQTQIEVRFEISTDGIVKVSAQDPRTGVRHSTTVSMSSGLSEAEIREIIERARTESVLDAPEEQVGGLPSSAGSPGNLLDDDEVMIEEDDEDPTLDQLKLEAFRTSATEEVDDLFGSSDAGLGGVADDEEDDIVLGEEEPDDGESFSDLIERPSGLGPDEE